MSAASDPQGPGGGAGRERGAAPSADAAAPPEPHGRTRHGRFHWPHLGRGHHRDRTDHADHADRGSEAAGSAPQTGPAQASAAPKREALKVPTGLGASLATSGGLLLAMVEDVRMRGGTEPEDLRPLADTFARHNAAKEATVRKALVRHDAAHKLVERDRHEGALIQDILDRALVGGHPEDTRVLTIDGALAQMYQYLFHERRDLVPAIERDVPAEESESLAAAFEAISDR